MGPVDCLVRDVCFIVLINVLVPPPLHVVTGHTEVEVVPRKGAILGEYQDRVETDFQDNMRKRADSFYM